MSEDTISRKAAIEAINIHLNKTDVPASYPGIITALEEWLNNLPSAQPDSKETSPTHKALDTISRQDAIDAMGKVQWAKVRLMELPSVHPQQRWIPCSERLPEKPNVYMVTDHDGRVVRYVYDDNESSREYWKRCAKAWMPLPEPYAERKTDE